ncbi:MAG: EF-hand domain-containing protein [Caulobacter sp.]|nr:EF-hand domain-containing protein [Caulobacter sp.]
MLQQLQQAMASRATGQRSANVSASIGQNVPGAGNSGSARPMRGSESGGANFSSETMGTLLSLQQTSGGRDAHLSEMFAKADTNGDGNLTADELATDMAVNRQPGQADPTSQISEIMSAADSNGDGSLSLDEFKAGAPKGPPPGPPPPPPPPPSDSASSDETTTDPLDTNGDGKVSMSELLASLQTTDSAASGTASGASDLLARLIKQLSTDTDPAASATVSLAA